MGTEKPNSKRKVDFFYESIVIATFSAWKNGRRTPTNGMIEPLISFFGPKTKLITLIDCPHPGSDMIIPIVEEYRDNKRIFQKKYKLTIPPLFILEKFNTLKTQPAFKIRDFFIVFQVLLGEKTKYDLYIGLESIHTLAGIILKKIGKVKKVVYYVSDYSPNRYSSKIFNSIYLWLDRYCAKSADFIWDVSPAMMPARIKMGLKPKDTAPLILVPNALFPWQIKHLPIDELKPYTLAFAGTIGPENGLDLALEALAIARKKIPQLTLHIIGGGLKKDEEKAEKIIKRNRLEKNVVHHGFISDLSKLSETLMKYMVGIAPYTSILTSVRWYADATKMRLYFANGLPAITTHVPPLGKEAQKAGAAIIVRDNKEELADAIIKIISEKDAYKNYRESAIKFAEKNTWENTYKNALSKMKQI